MKLKLTGPREGKSEVINGVTFINGYADHSCLPKSLEKYYGVVQDDEVFIEVEQEEEVNDGLQEETEEEVVEDTIADAQKELRELIESKKAELSKPRIKSYEEFSHFQQFASYVEELTGVRPKNKAAGKKYLKEYIDSHGGG